MSEGTRKREPEEQTGMDGGTEQADSPTHQDQSNTVPEKVGQREETVWATFSP